MENVFLTHSWENGVQCVGGLQVTWFVGGSVAGVSLRFEVGGVYGFNTRTTYCGPAPSANFEILKLQTRVFLHSEAQSNVLQP